MQVKNIVTGATENMRYDPARAAVEAGTHEFVNEQPGSVDDIAKAAKPKASTKTDK